MLSKVRYHIKNGSLLKVAWRRTIAMLRSIVPSGNISQSLFPLKNEKEFFFFENISSTGDNGGIYPLIYNEKTNSFSPKNWYLPKTETLMGSKKKLKDEIINTRDTVVVPIGVGNSYTKLRVALNGKKWTYNYFHPNRYNYFKFEKGDDIRIDSDQPVILGNPLPYSQSRKTKYKLVLQIFVDGLTYQVLKDGKLKSLMPNTAAFFENGTIYENCFSNGEWTQPSAASIFSGKYTVNHLLYHTSKKQFIGDGYRISSEYFQDSGYFTFQACQNWRKTPAYGYAKGFDRTIYRSAINSGLDAQDVNNVFFEQIHAFPERSHYAWLSYFDLHNVFYNILPDISSQIRNGMDAHNYEKNDRISVFLSKSNRFIESYHTEIGKLDRTLGQLYMFLMNTYSEDQLLISLVSDHGQSYLDEGTNPLRKTRSSVPFLLKGGGIGRGISNALMENVDILPTLLDLCDIAHDENSFDGQSFKNNKSGKPYVYTESYFPGQTYKACLRDGTNEFFLETGNVVNTDDKVDFSSFKTEIRSMIDGSRINDKSLEDRFIGIVRSHIEKVTKK